MIDKIIQKMLAVVRNGFQVVLGHFALEHFDVRCFASRCFARRHFARSYDAFAWGVLPWGVLPRSSAGHSEVISISISEVEVIRMAEFICSFIFVFVFVLYLVHSQASGIHICQTRDPSRPRSRNETKCQNNKKPNLAQAGFSLKVVQSMLI